MKMEQYRVEFVQDGLRMAFNVDAVSPTHAVNYIISTMHLPGKLEDIISVAPKNSEAPNVP